MLQTLARLFYRLPKSIQRPLERQWYENISRLDRQADMVFMNYGWADLDPDLPALPLPPHDQDNRYCIQLYHRVAAAIDLEGQDVLEVGCGRGGGASYVARTLKPRSLTGLDLTAASIRFCREHHDVPGLSFVRGNAEALEFSAETFDAVINVESSHCYPNVDQFFKSVYRVLKPGGVFLYADHRDTADVDGWRRQIVDAGLEIVSEENISANVTQALALDDGRKQALIQARVPRILRPFFNEFAGMEGTHTLYATLCSGEKVYLRFVARKKA
jgi:SAM-dependent methyltransferase